MLIKLTVKRGKKIEQFVMNKFDGFLSCWLNAVGAAAIFVIDLEIRLIIPCYIGISCHYRAYKVVAIVITGMYLKC